jgi:competence protein ComGC
MKTVVLLLVSALQQLQLVVSNLTLNKTKLKDVMCDATYACLDGEHCCYNTDDTPVGCCDDGFVCE